MATLCFEDGFECEGFRFMLKSMGLWQATVSSSQKTEDGFYRMDDEGNLTRIEDKHHKSKALRWEEI